MQDLIVRFLQGRASPSARRRLVDWIEEAPENREAFRETERLWKITEGVGYAAPVGDLPDPESLIHLASYVGEESVSGEKAQVEPEGGDGMETAERPEAAPRARVSRRKKEYLLRAAAAAVLSLGAGYWLGHDGERPTTLAASAVTTGAGEMTTVSLPDGSSVRLGPNSSVRFSRARGERIIDLSGRAFFGVAPDPASRFRVRTRHGEAAVFGTRFEVRSEQEEFRVLVVEGEVRVAAGDGSEARLNAGEVSLSRAGGPILESRIEDVFSQLDWMGNALVFHSTPLSEAALEIERRYGFEVEILDPALTTVEVTTTFTGQDLEEILMVLCEVVGAECVIEPNRARMVERASSAIEVD